MVIYNYENITYEFTGGAIINDPKDTKQEGVLLHFRTKDNQKVMEVFLDKRCAAHVVQLVQTGRQYWKPFRLPKMKQHK